MLLLACAGLLAACAPAQSTSPVVRPEIIKPGYDSVATCKTLRLDSDGVLQYTLVGVFPNKDERGITRDHYQVTCPNFTITHTRYGETVIRGLDIAELEPLLTTESVGTRPPYFWRVNWENRIDLSQPGVLTISSKDEKPDYGSAIVSARQGTGALHPVLYKGVVTPFTYDPARPVEIYVPIARSGYNWSRLIWDASTKTLRIDPEIPMPK